MLTLAECEKLLSSAPNCLALIVAWQRWRKNEILPNVGDVRPEELGSALRGISVAEVLSRHDTVFRFVSSLHEEIMGRDLQGVNLRDVSHPKGLASRMERLWNLASQPCGVVVTLNMIRKNYASEATLRLLLPVLPQNPSQPMRLYGALDRIGEHTTMSDDPVSQVAVADDFEYIDIGCGTP
jgi:hypothetical protein